MQERYGGAEVATRFDALIGEVAHRLAGAQGAADYDLAGENILTLSSRFTLHAQIAELAREVGATLRQDYEGTSLDAIRQIVAMDMGTTFHAGLYANSEIAEPDGDVALVPFPQERFTGSIGIVWRKTTGKHAGSAAFAEAMRTVTRDGSSQLVQVEGVKTRCTPMPAIRDPAP